MNGNPPQSYAARLEAFRKSDEERDKLVAELIQKYEELKVKYEEQQDDYQNEVSKTSERTPLCARLAVGEFAVKQCPRWMPRTSWTLPTESLLTSLITFTFPLRSPHVACGKVRRSLASRP